MEGCTKIFLQRSEILTRIIERRKIHPGESRNSIAMDANRYAMEGKEQCQKGKKNSFLLAGQVPF